MSRFLCVRDAHLRPTLPEGFMWLTRKIDKPALGDFCAWNMFLPTRDPDWLKILFERDAGVFHRQVVYIRKIAP